MRLQPPRPLARMAAAMEPVVFLGSALTVVAFVLFGALYDEAAVRLFTAVQGFIVGRLGWFYVLTVSVLLLVVLWLMLGPFGRIRLGGPDARPEFGYAGWFAMLFSAGMGTGLVFWSVAEPVTHFLEPPALPGVASSQADAMRVTFFHWGLHPWAVYAVFGLAIASTRCWASASAARWDTRWISSQPRARCSAWPRRWVSAPCRSTPALPRSVVCPRVPTCRCW